MTLAEELAENYTNDFYSVAMRYRTKDCLRRFVQGAIGEAIERCAQECEDYRDAEAIRKLKARS